MAEPKTKKTVASVEKFILAIDDEKRRDDCFAVIELMKSITKAEPAMWGTSIVGFGSYTYEYAGGKTADWPLTGFSPRKQNLSLYFISDFSKKYPELMEKLGKKFKVSKACLYINSLDDLHIPTLKQLMKISLADFKKSLNAKKTVNPKRKKSSTKK